MARNSYFRRSNPALSRIQMMDGQMEGVDRASYGGIAKKSIYFIVLTFLAAAGAFFIPLLFPAFLLENITIAIILLVASAILAGITGFIATLFPGATAVAGTIYAVAEGLIVGFTSLLVSLYTYEEGNFGGIVFAALFATIVVFVVMMVLYRTGIIRVGSGFKKFMLIAFFSMIFLSIFLYIPALFIPALYNAVYGTGILSIVISVIMVLLASFMLLLDLNRMTEMVEAGVEKRYEWSAAFGLLLTLVWLYLEFLKLFLKLTQRRR